MTAPRSPRRLHAVGDSHPGFDPGAAAAGAVSSAAEASRSQAPAAAPLDEVTLTRITNLAEAHLDPTPALAAHMRLLDTRGAWYAEQVLTHWCSAQPDAFWGLVNHYVRTHLAGPTTALDLPAWVAAGPPEEPGLRRRWDSVATNIPQPVIDRLLAERGRPTRDQVAATDTLVGEWPGEHWNRFVHAYVLVESVLSARGLQIPVLTD